MKTALWWILFALANKNFDAIRGTYLIIGVLLVAAVATTVMILRDPEMSPPDKAPVAVGLLVFGALAWVLPPLTLI